MSEAQERPSRGYGNIYTPHAGSMIIQVQRESGLANRTIILSERQVKLLRLIASRRGMVLMGLVAISWLYFAVQSARIPLLTDRLTTMEHESKKIDTLQIALTQLQQRYEQVSTMLGVTPTVVGATSGRAAGAIPAPAGTPANATPVSSPSAAAVPAAQAEARPPIVLQWPLEDRRFITRGLTRPSAYSDAHPGVDFAVPVGTVIRAAGPGVVVEVGENAEYGRFIRLSHADGYETLYAHNSEVSALHGATVAAGDAIARSGNTGRSTAPHLHFEVRHREIAVDPMQIIKR